MYDTKTNTYTRTFTQEELDVVFNLTSSDPELRPKDPGQYLLGILNNLADKNIQNGRRLKNKITRDALIDAITKASDEELSALAVSVTATLTPVAEPPIDIVN